eukprot:1871117-Lingulodinium_polyedra.AAC.1
MRPGAVAAPVGRPTGKVSQERAGCRLQRSAFSRLVQQRGTIGGMPRGRSGAMHPCNVRDGWPNRPDIAALGVHWLLRL